MMNDGILLYTLPQWFIFAGIIASVYGWVEHKKAFRLLGPFIFFLLGVYAVIALSGDYFASYEYLTPEELIMEDMEEEPTAELPFQAMLFPAYLTFVVAGFLSIPAFLLEWKNRKGRNLLLIMSALAGLAGFFIIAGALRSL